MLRVTRNWKTLHEAGVARLQGPVIVSCTVTILKTKTKVLIKGSRLLAAASPASARLGSLHASVLEFQSDGSEIKAEFKGKPDAKELLLDLGYVQMTTQIDI